MRRALFVLAVFLAAGGFSTTALAQEKIIKLKDGSVVKGVIVAQSGDVYKIKSPAFGFLSVRQADVSVIEDPAQAMAAPVAPAASSGAPEQKPAGPGAPQAPQMSGDWKAYQEKIVSNPDSMTAIQSLTQDKEMMEIINDPKLREAIFSGNIDYLKNNDKFLKFVNNPTVRKITETALGPEQGVKNGGQDKNQSGK